MGNVILIADLDRFTMRDAYENILRAAINPKSSYVPALHQSAEELRKLVRDLDRDASSSLARVLASITDVRQTVDCQTELDELRGTLEAAGPDEAKELKAAIADLEQAAREGQERFNKAFFSLIKNLRENLYGFEESQFPKRFKESFVLKRKQLDQLVIWSNEQLTPILKQIGSELTTVNAAIAEIMKKNIFDDTIALLPSAEAISKIDPATPEAGALKAGYEVILSALNKLSEEQNLSDLIEQREDLIMKRNKLRELYQKAIDDYNAVVKDLAILRELWTFHENVVVYMSQIKKMTPPLESYVKRLEQGLKAPLDSGEYTAVLDDLEGCLKQLNLIWR